MAFTGGALLAVGGLAYSQVQASKERSAAKKANKRAERIEAVKAQRERVQALRQNRISAANALAQGANAGVATSSGVQGAIGALGSETAENVSFAGQVDALNQQRLDYIQKGQSAAAKAQTGASVASLGFKVAGG